MHKLHCICLTGGEGDVVDYTALCVRKGSFRQGSAIIWFRGNRVRYAEQNSAELAEGKESVL
jgi:hypothetical protein